MARPFPHPRTGVFYFRQKVPADLRHILGNKIVSRSLRTKDPATAKLRNVEEVRKQALIWERHRKSPEPIPHKQIVALSGVVYRDYMAMLDHGTLCLRITPEAGSVKTGRYRVVPMHPQLVEMGLPEMIRSLPDGPIFYSTAPIRGKPANPVERAQSAGAKVGQWVRKVVGITDPDVQPSHAWRHRFKTIAREAGIDVEIRDAIQGHEDGRAASDYGEVTIRAMRDAIRRLEPIEVGSWSREGAT
ncbi:hypothetical protein QCN27_11580 [Cereibacter sp. SYSU M97828]|nr:hypothetical protein [Cereibacter flavus]